MIYKTLNGRYVDLSRIISIGEVKYISMKGWANAYGFEVETELLDHPIVIFDGWGDKDKVEIWHEDLVSRWMKFKTTGT